MNCGRDWKREEDGETKGQGQKLDISFSWTEVSSVSTPLLPWTRENMGISNIADMVAQLVNPPAGAVNASIDHGRGGVGTWAPWTLS